MKEKKVETIKIEEKETNMINGMQNNVNERLFIEPKQYKGVTLVALVVTILFSYDEKLKCSNSKGFLLATI